MNIKKILIGGSLLLLLAAIPLTVYFSQQKQETQSHAQKSTNLCFAVTNASSSATPACATGSIIKAPGDTFSLDVIMNPGNNVVTTVKLNIVYDATKLATGAAGITPNNTAVSPLTPTTYNTGNTLARLGIVINPAVGVDTTKALSQPTKIASIDFKVLDNANAGTASITFGQSLVLSKASQDAVDEDVLSSAPPLSITVNGPPVVTAVNQPPLCTSLNVDRSTTGAAPYPITFTANGRDPNGTINKVTFNFGDGPVQDVTQTGGIGTNTVSVQVAHTYNNAGTYSATATITDNQGTISSSSAACTQAITVTAASTRTSSTSAIPTISSSTSATPTSILSADTPTPAPSLAATGPGDTIIGVGAFGAVLTVIGGLLFLAL